MHTKLDSSNACFFRILRRRRTALVARRAPGALARGLFPASFALFFGWAPFAVVWCIFSIWFLARSFPALRDVAKGLDRSAGSNSAIETARELLEANADSPFAVYAIARGKKILLGFRGAPFCERDRRPFRALCLASIVLAATLLKLPLGVLEGVETPNPKKHLGQGNLSRAGEEIHREALHVQEKGASGNHERAGVRRASGIADSGAASGASPAGKDAKMPKEAQGTKRTGASANHADSRNAGDGSSGLGGEMEGDDSQLPAPGASALNMERADSNTETRRKKREPDRVQAGLNLSKLDSAPPAGRDESKENGEGDRPGEGRGGPSGAKKARGTAAFLPLIPEPDAVSGMLSYGPDILRREKAPPASGGAPEEAAIVSSRIRPEERMAVKPTPLVWKKMFGDYIQNL